MIGDRDNLEPGTKQNCPTFLRLLMRHVLHTETNCQAMAPDAGDADMGMEAEQRGF